MKQWIVLLITFTLLLFLSASAAQASTYYVAKTGDDGNPGTEASPFLTVEQGITSMSAGDTLYIRDGTYTEFFDSNNRIVPSGTSWDNPVTIAAYPGETPIIDAGNTIKKVFYFGTGDQYIKLDGLTLQGGYAGLWMDGTAQYFRFFNLTIRNNETHGGLLGGQGDYWINNCTVYSNGTSLGRHGFYVGATANVLIENCDIYDNHSSSVKLISTGKENTNHIVRNNRMHGGLRGMEFGIETQNQYNYVYNNLIYDNTEYGILISTSLSHYFVYNNVFYNIPYAITISHTAGSNGPPHDVYVYNNIFYGNQTGYIIGDSAFTNMYLHNNIFYKNSIADITETGSFSPDTQDNYFIDPYFTDPANYDFTLTSRSPVDTGLTLADVAIDFSGISRPQGSGYDIGAYEFVPATTPTLVPSTTVNINASSTTTKATNPPSATPISRISITPVPKEALALTNDYITTNGSINFWGKTNKNSIVSILIKQATRQVASGVTKSDINGDWSWILSPTLKVGDYVAKISIQDEKGNTGETSVNFSISQDGQIISNIQKENTQSTTLLSNIKSTLSRIVSKIIHWAQ